MYEDIIQSKARRHKVDPNLVKAIIKVESNWQPNAIGDDGLAFGLMQVWLSTARERSKLGNALTKEMLLKPSININQGVGYLREQYNRYRSWKKAVAAYNAGGYFVDPKTGYAVNQKYVNKVAREYKKYSGKPFTGRGENPLLLILTGILLFSFISLRRIRR